MKKQVIIKKAENKKIENRECSVCFQPIDTKNKKYVQLSTYNIKNSAMTHNEHDFYHFECFCKWHNDKINESALNQTKELQEKLITILKSNPLFEKIAPLLEDGIYNTQLLLQKQMEQKKKIQNGRRTTKKGTRRTITITKK